MLTTKVVKVSTAGRIRYKGQAKPKEQTPTRVKIQKPQKEPQKPKATKATKATGAKKPDWKTKVTEKK